MEESLKINVKLTEKDLKKNFFEHGHSEIKLRLVLSLIFSALFGLYINLVILNINRIVSRDTISIPFIVIIMIIFLATILFQLYKKFIGYPLVIKNLKKIKLIGEIIYYEFKDNKIYIFSKNISNILYFNNILINEYKECFVIKSVNGDYIIPRRCFKDKYEMYKFLDICTSNVDPKKLRLKNYEFSISQPDYGEDEFINKKMEYDKKNNSENILVEISFSLNTREIQQMNLKKFYKSPLTIFITFFGIILVTLSIIKSDIQQNICILSFLLGLILIYIPIKFGYEKPKSIKKDDIRIAVKEFKFKEDGIILSFNDYITFINWNRLLKVKETKSNILLYETKQISHVIPKRVFDDRKENLNLLRKIIKEKVKNTKVKVEE